jgi:hypothetical protein
MPITAQADLKGKEVPSFLQMQESPDPTQPGVVAQMGLKLGGDLEPPDRVSVTAWDAEQRDWNMPVKDMGKNTSVVLYWGQKKLNPGEKRWAGYTYGLGQIHTDAAAKNGSRLALTLDGDLEADTEFTVLAYVLQPQPGQKVKLFLAPGLSLVKGAAEQPVPPSPDGSVALLTWTVRAAEAGAFEVVLQSGPQLSLRHTVYVTKTGFGRTFRKQDLFD